MIELAVLVALSTLAVGLVVALLLRQLPTVRLQLAGLALLAVLLPLSAVLLSGWVMFHMGDDVKILAVTAASASTALVVALLVARPIGQGIDRLGEASSALAAGDLGARAPEEGPRSWPSSRGPSTRWRRTSRRSSTLGASSSRGRATTCGRRSRRSRR